MEHEKLADFWDSTVDKSQKHFVNSVTKSTVTRWRKMVDTHFIKNLNFGEIKTAYDWGCGGGIHTKTLSKLCDVTPLDISEDSLEACTEYTGIDGILITDLDSIRDSTVDLIFSVAVVHHFPSLSYLDSVIDVWKNIDPKFICIQFKVNNIVKSQAEYFKGSNYMNGLKLTKDYISSKLETYSIMYYKEESTANKQLTNAFIILSK